MQKGTHDDDDKIDWGDGTPIMPVRIQDAGDRSNLLHRGWVGGRTRIPVDIRLAVLPSGRTIVSVNNTVKKNRRS
jgi:hypothetical protein